MASIGSVFLGDFQRIRHLSSSTHSNPTPPSSPPPTGTGGIMYSGRSSTSPLTQSFDDLRADLDGGGASSSGSGSLKNVNRNGYQHDLLGALLQTPPKPIDPVLALELRLRWLEAIVLGVKQDTGAGVGAVHQKKGKEREKDLGLGLKAGETLIRLAENVQSRLGAAVEGNEGLKKFMDSYDQHAHLLSPSFALSGILQDSPAYENMTPEEFEAFLTELEQDIRGADRDMRELDTLVKKGVTSAGKLPDYEKLQPRLDTLLTANQADSELSASLEKRIASLMERHTTSVDVLSELFVAWDDAVTGAEDSIVRMERGREERRRLGLE